MERKVTLRTKGFKQYKNGSKGKNPGQAKKKKKKKKNPGSVHVSFVVGKVALGQVFLRILWFSSDSFIPPVLHYSKKLKKEHYSYSSQSCGASVASTAGPFKKTA
jgi:hypothetical protein